MRRLLLDLAAEPDIVTALRIADELRRTVAIDPDVDLRLLISAVADEDPLVSIGALHALAATGDHAVDDVLVAALSEERAWIREHAAWTLAARRPSADAIAGLLSLHATGSDLTAMVAQRTLLGWIDGDVDVAGSTMTALAAAVDTDLRRRLVDTLGRTRTEAARDMLRRIALSADEAPDVRLAAVGACADDRHPSTTAALHALVDDSSVVATAALLALADRMPTDPSIRPRRAGLRVGQLTLTGELDPQLTRAGTGDTGGIANLLVTVSRALVGHDDIDSVLTIGRSSLDGELASLLTPDLGPETWASVSFGASDRPATLTTEWDYRLMLERSIGRVLRQHPQLDLLHLRMADVGTLAAASVARRLGVRLVFTCAPDPHLPIAQRQASGAIDRESFGDIDLREHLWFRARMVERLAAQADHLVLFPRTGVREVVADALGLDRQVLHRSATIAPEGIDVAAIDAARVTERPTPIVAEIAGRLPAERRGRALVLSVGRLHPVKGMTRLVREWLSDDELTTRTNLVIVGGNLGDPNPVEAAVLSEVQELVDTHPAGAGVLLLGARPPAEIADLLVATDEGSPGVIAPGGVYANGAAKEEFGLAVLEALAAGIPVVAPRAGGPSTYVVDGVNGILVEADADLAPALRGALDLHALPGRAEAAQRLVRERYSIDAYADALATAYRRAVEATTSRAL